MNVNEREPWRRNRRMLCSIHAVFRLEKLPHKNSRVQTFIQNNTTANIALLIQTFIYRLNRSKYSKKIIYSPPITPHSYFLSLLFIITHDCNLNRKGTIHSDTIITLIAKCF